MKKVRHMSTNVYTRILWWNGERGIAKDVNVEVKLHFAPNALPNIAECDFGEVEPGQLAYVPQIREQTGERQRDMKDAEIEAVRAYLKHLHAVVEKAL